MRHLELHILQSVPVACLNRDDLGSPKTAVFGGVQRARVSSQCWKRAIREYSSELLPMRFQGERTRLIVEPLRDIFVSAHGMDEETALGKAKELAEAVAKFDADSAKKGKLQTKTLFFTSRSELEALALSAVNNENVKKHAKSFAQSLCTDAADIALFGRMVASAPDLTLEGAAMFSHALSTHKADNEIDFFSALDDLQPAEETGAGMTGTLEFNAATYYRFCALNLDMLADAAHLGALSVEERQDIVAAFVEATLKAMPGARKNSMNANTMPAYVLCVLRDAGHPVQLVNAFEKAVYSPDGKGYVEASVKRMDEEYRHMETVWGLTAAETIRMPQQSLGELLQGVRRHVR